MPKLAQKELKRIFAEHAGPSVHKAAVEAFLDVFHFEFEEAKTEFENAFYYFVVDVLTEMAANEFI